MKSLLTAIAITIATSTMIYAQEWHTDFNKAQQLAQQQDKPIILVFQGSDWCAPCMKLDREVWSTDTFNKYAMDHYVMLQADFPRRRKNALDTAQQQANNQLAEKYNKNGVFPLVVILDQNGKLLGQKSYKKTTPQQYIDEINSIIK